MKCVQCGMVSCIEESLGGHLKAIHLTTKMCDVSGEVSIFVAFLSVSYVNVLLSWTGEIESKTQTIKDYESNQCHPQTHLFVRCVQTMFYETSPKIWPCL